MGLTLKADDYGPEKFKLLLDLFVNPYQILASHFQLAF